MGINIDKNHDDFVHLLRLVKRDDVNVLIHWLEKESDFFTAPCSTRYHLSERGGLCQHSLNVFDALNRLVPSGHSTAYDDFSILLVSLLHDICKANTYKEGYRWSKDSGEWEQIKTYSYDEKFAFGHSEKSVYIVSKFIRLTDYEAQAINAHMGFSDIRGAQLIGNIFKQNELAVLLHLADMYASYIMEGT